MNLIADFAATFPFPLDDFQTEAMEYLTQDTSVLVAAPTGSGKTLVGEFATWLAMRRNGKCYYTTPIKALSNQKYNDFCEIYGEENVGLLTGDNSVNASAPIVVMTTEVLRNMIYERSGRLDNLMFVVLDEVHFLGDKFRGAVWEEIIIQLSSEVVLVGLSATVSNAEEFGEWLRHVRSGCHVIISEHRPVPLEHTYALGDELVSVFEPRNQGKPHQGKPNRGKGRDRNQEQTHSQGNDDEQASEAPGSTNGQKSVQLYTNKPNKRIMMLEQRARSTSVTRKGNWVRNRGNKILVPRRDKLVRELQKLKWLPAIIFIFSRKNCDEAVSQIMGSNAQLTTEAERREIRAYVEELAENMSKEDILALNFKEWARGLELGVAAHHAGVIPLLKEAVEILFCRGLLKVVYATETLALGINMPARTVVIERLDKWDGTGHTLLSPGQLTQLTGRAGRRGKDVQGHAVVLFQKQFPIRVVSNLIASRTEKLESRFKPTYNMTINMLNLYSLDMCQNMLRRSFAQFQSDLQFKQVQEEIRRNKEALEGYAKNCHSEFGDFDEYWSLKKELYSINDKANEHFLIARAKTIEKYFENVVPGAVLEFNKTPRQLKRISGVILAHKQDREGNPRYLILTNAGAVKYYVPQSFKKKPKQIGFIDIQGRDTTQKLVRKQILKQIRNIAITNEPLEAFEADLSSFEQQKEELKALVANHVVASDPAIRDLEYWRAEYDSLARRNAKLQDHYNANTNSLTALMGNISKLLVNFGYIDELTNKPTDIGLVLANIHSELDLLLAESLRHNFIARLTPFEMASWATMFTSSTYTSEGDGYFDIPTSELEDVWDLTLQHHDYLRAVEAKHSIYMTSTLNGNLMSAMMLWAEGVPIKRVLYEANLSSGHFVREAKMAADLLRQIANVSQDSEVANNARIAETLIIRGIVAW